MSEMEIVLTVILVVALLCFGGMASLYASTRAELDSLRRVVDPPKVKAEAEGIQARASRLDMPPRIRSVRVGETAYVDSDSVSFDSYRRVWISGETMASWTPRSSEDIKIETTGDGLEVTAKRSQIRWLESGRPYDPIPVAKLHITEGESHG